MEHLQSLYSLEKDLEEAVRLANKVAVLTVYSKGAQGAMLYINTLGGIL